MASATARVLALPELLERIFLQCEPRSLLQAMAVSHYFEDQITNSPRIQQKLFLEPCNKVLACPINNEKQLVPEVLINPFLLDPNDIGICNPVSPEDMAACLETFAVHLNFWSSPIAQEACCRSMYLTSPPASKIDILNSHHESPTSGKAPKWLPYSVSIGKGMYNLLGNIEHPDGVLIGDVLDVLEQCGVAGELCIFKVQMFVEVEEGQMKELGYDCAHYEAKELIEVQAKDERLTPVRFCVSVQQSD